MAQAVVFIDTNESCFEPLTLKTKHKCLLPLANIPIVDYTLDCLKKSNFATVTLLCSSHVNDIRTHINSLWVNQGLAINVVDGSKCKGNLGEALGLLDKKKFTQPFLIMYGDSVSNIDFQEILQQYQAQHNKQPTCQMLALLKELPKGHLQANRKSAVVWDSSGKIYFEKDGRNFLKNESSKQQMGRGLLAYAAVCAPTMLSFTDDFKSCGTFQKIMWALQRDPRKIKHPALATHFLRPDQFICRVTSLHKFALTLENVLSGQATDYAKQRMLQQGYELTGDGDFRHKSAKINPSVIVFESASIGPDSVVGRHTRIMNSTIGKGCKIGANVWIEGASIGDGVVIEDNARIVFSILDKKVRIGEDATVMSWCVLGEEVVVNKDVTKPCFSYEWKGKKAPDPMDVDEAPGPHEITDWDNLDVDSDDDVELLTHGIEPELPAEVVAEICEMFFDYLMVLYEQCLADKNIMKRCVKEITDMRRAWRIPIRDMARLVTRGVIMLPVYLNSSLTADQYMASEQQMLNTFKTILEYMIRTRESMVDCQNGIQDAVNASPNVIQPHHNEIIDLLRTVNIIHERPAPPPLDPKDMERRKKEQERHMRGRMRGPGGRGMDDDDDMDEEMQLQIEGAFKRRLDND